MNNRHNQYGTNATWQERFRKLTSQIRSSLTGPVDFNSIDALVIEPRVLYSASPFPIDDAFLESIDVNIDQAEQGIQWALDDAIFDAPPIASPAADELGTETGPTANISFQEWQRVELVFVDANLADFDTLLADLQNQNEVGTWLQVAYIDSSEDGLGQIADYLAQFGQPIDAIHIITHGSDGVIPLVNSYTIAEFNYALHNEQISSNLLSDGAYPESQRSEIAFIDSGVADYETIIANLDANVEVIILDAEQDGLLQITQALAGRSDIDALHIFSHGVDGGIQVGATWINGFSIQWQSDIIASWSSALSADADLLLYGCNIASTADGQEFLSELALLTGADVAASSDETGHVSLGGDWDLEYSTGAIEANTAVDADDMDDWDDLLAITANGTATSGQTASGNSLSFSHTVASGSNRVLYVTLAIDSVGAGVNSVTYGGVNLTQVGRTAGNHAVEIWRLVNPSVGTANVFVNLGATTAIKGGAVTYNGVDQATSNGTYTSAAGTGTTATLNVSSGAGKLVLDITNWDNNPTGYTIGANQSSVWSLTNTDHRGVATTEAGAATVTMSSTVSASNQWEMGAISINEAPTPPVNTLPGAQSTSEDVARVFSVANGNAISITDADAGGANNQITISVSNGTLTLAGTTGLTFVAGDGTTDTTMTIRGTAAAINTSLNGLSYSPTANYNGSATLTLATMDSTLLSLNIDAGLTGLYTFDSTGDLGNDSSPAGANDGTNVGATTTTDGTRGNVLSFDGNDYVQINGRFGNPSNLTLAAWVNLTTADSGGAEVISLGDSVILRLDEAGQLMGIFYNGSTWVTTSYNVTLAGTGWHHVAYSFNDAGNVATLFLDGVQVASTSTFNSISYTLGSNSFIGKHGNGGTTWDFTGKIDDARVYNRSLTATEIWTLANDLALTDTDTVNLTVNAVNDAPVMTFATPTLPLTEDTAPFSATVASLLSTSVTDVDSGAVEGIAITGLTGSGGILEYSINGGSSWQSIGAVTGSNALLLRETDLLRFSPNGVTGGDTFVSYRAWDQTSSSAGNHVDATSTGGITAFSTQTNTITVNVSSINDAPVLDNSGTMVFNAITENQTNGAGQLVSSIISSAGGDRITDVDSGALEGIAITALNNGSGGGYFEFSINGGAAWNVVATNASNTNALLLRSSDLIRFVPNQADSETATISFRAWDRSFGTQGNYVSTATNGGTSAFSSAIETATMTTTAVNDAPVLDNSGLMVLTTITEDQTSNSGNTVAQIISSAGGDRVTDIDSGALEGIAITSLGNANGTWQFTTNGFLWADIGSVSESSALLLRSTDLVRFIPNGDNGATASFDFRAWDRTSGSVGSKVDVTTNGGSTAFSSSSETATITVTDVNDEQVISTNAGASFNENSTSNLITTAMLGTTDVDSASSQLIYTITGYSTTGSLHKNGVLLTNGGTFTQADIDSNLIAYSHNGAEVFSDNFSFSVDDGFGTASIGTFNITLNPVNDQAVTITSNGGGASASITQNETISFVTQVTVNDGDLPGDTFTYSIIGGLDQNDFTIDSSGNLSFVAGPDYESPTDSDLNNVYTVTVQVSDGVHTDSQTITVTIVDVQGSALTVTTTQDVDDTGLGASYTIEELYAVGGGTDGHVSLREAIIAANNTLGADTIGFAILNTDAGYAGTTGVDAYWQISLTAALPTITESVILDGLSQTSSGGNVNPGTFGINSSVGTGAQNVYAVDRPEITIVGASGFAGIVVGADDVTIQGFSMYGFSSSAAILLNDGTSNALIQFNVLGSGPTAIADPGAGLNNDQNVQSLGADNGTLANNILAYSKATGFYGTNGSNDWNVISNHFIDSGYNFSNGDAIAMNASVGGLIDGNIITGSSTQAIILSGSTSGVTISNNTITGNAVGPIVGSHSQYDAIALRSGTNNILVSQNIIADNYGAGLTVNNGAYAIEITQNSFYGNGTILSRQDLAASGIVGLDLQTTGENANFGTAPYYTANDLGDADTGGNSLQNFPVISSASSDGTRLNVTGSFNSVAGRTYRIEFFLSDAYANGHGQGETYLGSVNVTTDGSGNTTFSESLIASIPAGMQLTATATDLTTLETSEFSQQFAINDAPVESSIEGTPLPYTENQTATEITSTLTLADEDDTHIESAVIAITANYANGQDVLAFANTANITGVWDSGSGTLTLTGSDTVANYQAALRSITYANTSDSPSTATRTVSFTINDGQEDSNTMTRDITVTAVNDAPVVNFNYNTFLTGITEDQIDNAGQTVASVLASSGQDIVTDVDSGAVEGIAITSLNTGFGKWQYSLDGGSNWLDVGTVSNTSALLLRSTDLIRFLPQYENGSTPDITFRAWDQSSGTAGTKVTTASNGGTTAFSSAVETASIVVTDVNDAPILDSLRTPVLSAINEDAGLPVGAVGSLVSSLVDFQLPGGQVDNVADDDIGAQLGIAVTSTNTANGTWYYSTDNGANWSVMGSVSDASSRLLAADANTRIYFAPTANYNGTISDAITFRAWDRSSGSNAALADTTNNGGSTAFSTAIDTAGLTITSVNDAPVAVSDSATALEAGGASNGTAGTNPTGNVLSNDTDVDAADTKTISGVASGVSASVTGSVGVNVAGSYGSINIASDGSYTYTVDNNNATVQALRNSGQSVSDVFTYTMTDAGGLTSTTQISVNLQGANDAPLQSGIEGLALAYTENDGTVVVTTTLSLSDVDDANLASAVVQITGNYVSGQDWLLFTNQNGITGSWDSDTGMLTLAGTATKAEYETALRSVSYSNSSEIPNTSTRTVTFTVSDGALNSNSVTRAINVTSVNDAPVNALPGVQTVDVNTTLTLSGADAIQISDVDAASSIVRVTLTASNGSMTLASTAGLTFTTGDGVNDASMVLTGTIANINSALDGLQFIPTNGYVGTANISLLTEDLGNSGTGGNLSDNDSLAIQVGGVRFQEGANGYTGTQDTYVSGSGASTAYGNATSVLVDDPSQQGLIRFDNIFGSGAGQIAYGSTITSATLSIYVTGTDNLDDVQVRRMLSTWTEASTWNSLSSGIQANGTEASTTVSYTIDAGVGGWITISGITSTVQAWSDGAANFGWALIGVDADNWSFHSSEFSTVSLRPYLSVSFNAPQSSSVDLDANNSTGVSGSGVARTWTENGGPVAISDTDATIADADSSNLQSMIVRISNLLDGTAESLAANTTGTSISASYNSTTGELTLSGSDSVAHYQQVLRTITYNNISESPSSTSRLITVQAADAFVQSNIATSTIQITAVNDAPVLDNSGNMSLSSITEDQLTNGGDSVSAILASAGGDRITDVDSGAVEGIAITSLTSGNGTWQYSIDNGTNWYNVGAVAESSALLLRGSDLVRFVPNAENATAANFTFRAWDQTGATVGGQGTKVNISTTGGTTAFSSATEVASITVNAVNDAPTGIVDTATAVEAGGVANGTTGVSPTGNVLTNDTDVDAGDTKTVSGVAAGVVGSASGSVSTGVNGNYGSINIAANGAYVYTIDNSNAVVQALRTSGNTLQDVFSYTITDAGGLTSTTQITITIQGANDTPYDITGGALSINENSANATNVGTVTGQDVDSGETFTYSLTDSAGGRFAIDNAGLITVANGSLLNREVAPSHTITVRVTDAAGATFDKNFTININDVDEFDVSTPTDANATSNAVNENAADGTLVGITASSSDADATTNTVTYSLFDSAGGRFAIDANTGVVTVANGSLLDRETAASYNITVRATSADGSSADTVFTINLNDIDEFDVGAVTDSDATANSVVENASIGTVVNITGLATDDDATTNAITYSLFDNDGGRFAIDGSTGVVTVAASIDREADGASRNITIRATSADGSYSDQVFTIAINDADEFNVTTPTDASIDDNDVDENVAIGTTVGVTANAFDLDATDNIITYSLTSNPGDLFQIDANTGVVTTAAAINRELHGATRNITVQAQSSDGSTASQVFTIAINDVNEFDVSTPTDADIAANEVDENVAIGTGVGVTANAFDLDATVNTITYTLTSNPDGLFQINSATGVVTTAAAINREAHGAMRSITVQAQSSDGSTATQTFNIAINDVNEFDVSTPTDADITANEVDENVAIGTSVGVTANAFDLDATANTITYTLTSNPDGLFQVNSATGVVTTAAAINREVHGATRSITVQAQSSDGSTATQTFIISISDVDEFDVGAITDANAANNTIAEDAATGISVGLTAFAQDADATSNTITYSLDDNAGGLFSINATTGVVTVAGSLDYETANSHNISVRATSADSSYSTETFTIDVTDVNESAISAISDNDVNADFVLENSTIGTVVGVTAFAVDDDGTDVVTYSLDSTAGGRFAIDATSGVVTVAGAIDREAAGSYDIMVRAASTDGTFTTRLVTIAVGDLDEFNVGLLTDTNGTTNAVVENSAIGTSVGIVAFASDNDATTNTIIYTLTNDDGGRFTIDANSGAVTVAGAIDREADGATRNITVRATSADGSFTDQSFTIDIVDDNEFDVTTPTDTDNAFNEVDENVSIGTTVSITANAFDLDATTNAIAYSLTNNPDGLFQIDSTTGVVSTAAAIDREAHGASRSITVQAQSSDGSTATQTFTITINDVNEFAVTTPTDSNATANEVSENAVNGTLVGLTAWAFDADATTNAVTYSLDDNAGGRFAIDSSTGVVSVADGSLLDYESLTSHNIVVRATSADSSSSTATFTINLTDANEATVGAISDSDTAANFVLENSAIGTSVGITAGAVDPDGTDVVTYTLDDDAGGRFAIDVTTGVVTVAGAIDREAAPSYDIVVRATSSDNSYSTQLYTIQIGDVNEFGVSPVVDQNSGANSVLENASIGTTIGITANALDNDATNNSVSYSLIDDDSGRFGIDSSSGIVTVAGALNRETDGPTRTITIRATSIDGSISDENFTINIIDVNEFSVTVPLDNDSAANEIDENVAIGTAVGITANAFDADATNSSVTYSLVDNPDGLFAIDATTGTVTTAAAIDRENHGANRSITVQATSSDGSFTSQVFYIAINDIDEFNVGPIIDADITTNIIDENAAVGSSVGVTANAADLDATNNQITYSLDNDSSGRYAIDATTGVVTVAGSIDYEVATSHTIVARATSQDGSFNTQSFTIQIADVNEFAISSIADTNPAAQIIAENSIGATVGITAYAFDQDGTNNTITYTLDDSANGKFAIDSISGVVTTIGGLDYETSATETIVVRATSADGSSATASYTVVVTDVNEFGVSAINDSDAAADYVLENAVIGTSVGVTAFAIDADGTDSVSYSLDTTFGGLFAIDSSTGVVTVAGAIDRELAASYNLIVRATSTDSSTITGTFTVLIGDVNEYALTTVNDLDASPNFIFENVAIGTQVGITANSVDYDATNNTVSYTLVDSDSGRFAIDATSGIVATAAAIDRERIGASRSIIVRATSSDGSWIEQSFVINIGDVDENDASPVVDLNSAINQVYENAAIGTAIGITASSYDADATNNVITYSLIDSDAGRFSIDAVTGIVRVAGAIDREALGLSRYIVVRADSQDGSFMVQTFAVTILDVNEFGISGIQDVDAGNNSVQENSVTNSVVGLTASAFDNDATNNLIAYALTDDAGGRFKIDASSGVVRVNNGTLLDFETSASHQITVRATSQDGSTSLRDFDIQVSDVNEAPLAKGESYSTSYIDVLNVGSSGVLANDTDPDGNPLNVVLVSGPTQGTLVLSSNGSFTYTPKTGFVGSVSFAYIVTDGVLVSAPTQAVINLTLPTNVNVESGPSGNSSSPSSSTSESSVAKPTSQPKQDPAAANPTTSVVPLDSHPGSSKESSEGNRNRDTGAEQEKALIAAGIEISSEDTAQSNDSVNGMKVGGSNIVRTRSQSGLGSYSHVDLNSFEIQHGSSSQRELERIDSAIMTVNRNDDSGLIEQTTSVDRIVIKTVISTGVVIWIVQSAQVVATVMSTAPVWMQLDPLVVIAENKRGILRDEEEDKSMRIFDVDQKHGKG